MPIWLVSLGTKFGGYVALAVGALGLLLKFKLDAEKEGASKVQSKIDNHNAEVQSTFNEIDNRSVSVDDALNRLSKRS